MNNVTTGIKIMEMVAHRFVRLRKVVGVEGSLQDVGNDIIYDMIDI